MFLFWKEGYFSFSINDIINVVNDYLNQEMCNVNTAFTKNMTQSKKILHYIYAITITFCRK